jgi:hypothetical protein
VVDFVVFVVTEDDSSKVDHLGPSRERGFGKLTRAHGKEIGHN